MRVRFTCRHTRLTPALRTFTEEKLARLARYLDDASEVHVVLSAEKHRYDAEMIITGPRRHFTGSAITDDLYAAVGLVLDKLAKQVRRDKRRRDARRRRGARSAVAAPARRPAGRGALPEPRRRSPPDMTVAEATRRLAGNHHHFVVFRNADSERICVLYRRPDGRLDLVEDDRPIPSYP